MNMTPEHRGALKRLIEEVKQKRYHDCQMKDCVCNDLIGGNDIDLVEQLLNNN